MFTVDLDKQEKDIYQMEQNDRNNLAEVIKCDIYDEKTIRRIGELARDYNDRRKKEYLNKLVGEVNKRMIQFQAEIQNQLSLDHEDMSAALECFKFILKYKESISVYLPESQNIYDSVIKAINDAFIKYSQTIECIGCLQENRSVETAVKNIFSCYRYENSQNILTKSSWDHSRTSFEIVKNYLLANSDACKVAIDELNIPDLIKFLSISQKCDNVLLYITNFSSRFNFLINFANIINYENMIEILRIKVAEYAEEKKNIEVLIISETERFNVEAKENLCKNINASINKLKEISVKLRDFLASQINLEDLLSQVISAIESKINNIEERLNEVASKKKPTQNEYDTFRFLYQDLEVLSKFVVPGTSRTEKILKKVETITIDKVEEISKEILQSLNDPGIVAEKLNDIACISENLYMFKNTISKEIDDILAKYKKINGPSGISNLSMVLENLENVSSLIAQHPLLVGEQ